MSHKISSLIKASELNQLIKQKYKGLKILDCTYPSKKGYNGFKNSRISKSMYLDIGNLRDNDSHLTLQFPKPRIFKKYLDDLKINKQNTIVCYDQYGIYSSPRAWFIFKAFGFSNVSILDGGLKNWITSGYEVNSEQISDDEMINFSYIVQDETPTEISDSDLTVDESYLAKFEDVLNFNTEYTQVIDTRPMMNFELYNIPRSKNIPFDTLTNKNGLFKTTDELSSIYVDHKIDPSKKIISSCGIGLSACISFFVTKEILKYPHNQIYNGSIEEYSIKSQQV